MPAPVMRDYQGLPDHTGGASAPVVNGLLFQQGRWDLSTVLLRDYQTVGNLSQQLLPQTAVIVIRFVLAAVCLSWFNGWMTSGTVCGDPPGTSLLRSGACARWGRSAPISSRPSVKRPPASWNMSMAFKPSGPSIWPASTFKALRNPLTRSGRRQSGWRPARPRR